MADAEVKTKYCRDCHFSRNKYADMYSWRCYSPNNLYKPINISLVTGEADYVYDNCHLARLHTKAGCGTEARWFMSTAEYLAKELPSLSSTTVNTSSRRLGAKIGIDDI